MTKKKAQPKEHIHYHKDGSIWAKGKRPAECVLVGVLA